jgi:hypothetical protein
LLQICAGSADTAIHALRDIAKHTRGAMHIRRRLDGFVSPARQRAFRETISASRMGSPTPTSPTRLVRQAAIPELTTRAAEPTGKLCAAEASFGRV